MSICLEYLILRVCKLFVLGIFIQIYDRLVSSSYLKLYICIHKNDYY